MRCIVVVVLVFALGLTVACGNQASDPAEASAPQSTKVTSATEVTLTTSGTAFISPSGISIQTFTTALGNLVGEQVRKVVTNIKVNDFRRGVKDGMQNAGRPAYSIEAMSSAVAKVESSQQGSEQQAYTPSADEVPIIGYAMGFIQGTQISQMGVNLNPDTFADSFAEAFAEGAKNYSQSQQTVSTYITELRSANQAGMQAKGASNLNASKEFLAENRSKPGIEETTSGLQYEILAEGEGTKPNIEDTVRVHYRGTLLDGTEFDSSYKRNQPAEFMLRAVIPGWTEALQLMQVGSRYRLYIPPELAYGEHGSPPKIGANELLVFEVELLDILKK